MLMSKGLCSSANKASIFHNGISIKNVYHIRRMGKAVILVLLALFVIVEVSPVPAPLEYQEIENPAGDQGTFSFFIALCISQIGGGCTVPFFLEHIWNEKGRQSNFSSTLTHNSYSLYV